jgi:hypothetical protein
MIPQEVMEVTAAEHLVLIFKTAQPYRTTDVYTDHWYSKFAPWLLEWFLLAACVGLPILTHKAVRRGARNALDGLC